VTRNKEILHEKENTSKVHAVCGNLRMWQPSRDTIHGRENQCRSLFEVPSIFHRTAEDRRFGWQGGKIQEALREKKTRDQEKSYNEGVVGVVCEQAI